jgi:hypothetical protein
MSSRSSELGSANLVGRGSRKTGNRHQSDGLIAAEIICNTGKRAEPERSVHNGSARFSVFRRDPASDT